MALFKIYKVDGYTNDGKIISSEIPKWKGMKYTISCKFTNRE